MFYQIRDRERWVEFGDFLRQLRRRFPDRPALPRAGQLQPAQEGPGLRPVASPTTTAKFTALRCFALNGSAYPHHATQNRATASYMRWRNARAKPKTKFAIGSKIRDPDYLPLSA